MIVLYLLLFILILGILVCFHEYGHYYFAKKAGIQINEFSFGMGPKIVSKKKGDTYWSIRAFPIGGFCAMSGEDATYTPVKVNDEVRVIFNEDNKIIKIILNKDNPDFALCELIKVEKVDLFGKDGASLYINDYEVLRDAELVYSKKEEYRIATEERLYTSKTVWQRFKVCFGGPLNNLLLGIVVFLILGLITGVSSKSSIVGESQADNINKGDEIEYIGSYKIDSWDDIESAIYNTKSREISVTLNENKVVSVNANYYFVNMDFSSGEGMKMVVSSESKTGGTNKSRAYTDGGIEEGSILKGFIYEGVRYDVESWEEMLNLSREKIDGGSIILIYIDNDGNTRESSSYKVLSNETLDKLGYSENSYKKLGISPKTEFNFFGGLYTGIKGFLGACATIFSTLWLLLTSSDVGLNDMGGFITIFEQTAESTESISTLLYWIGLLSVNLGIVNLLPIPALDGGRLLFIVVEGITHKKLKPKVENIIINVFFYLLMGLMVYILFQDILRVFEKNIGVVLKTFLLVKKIF